MKLILVTVLSAWVATAGTWSQAPTTQPVQNALRAELIAARGLYSPNRPILLRFTLRNVSDHAVEIPLQTAADSEAGIALPLGAVFGTDEQPALAMAYADEKPVIVPPPQAAEQELQPGGLRLAPRGSVGTEVDLRAWFPSIRYAGTYRAEWCPLGGQAGTATVEFQVEPRRDAIIVTDRGKLTFSLMYDQAPRNVEAFLELARDGFYDGKTIHRVIPGRLIQGGCPKGDGTGIRPDGRLLPAEFHDAPFELGTLAMARKVSEDDSASCQFFITLARLPELDGHYTIIGQASDEESIRTLNQISAAPTDRHYRPRTPLVIRSINLVDRERTATTHFGLKPVPAGSPAAPSEEAPNP